MAPQAWNRLVTTFGPIVYRWCRASHVPMSDAADVVQEVFSRVVRGIGNFERQKNAGSFRSWLATITRNRTADYFRRAAKSQAAVGGTNAMNALEQLAESVDSTITPESIQGAFTRQLLTQVRVEFETITWTAFWLTTMEGKSASEAAEATGLSRASVYQAKSRVLRRLRQRLCEVENVHGQSSDKF
tara:strand:+ start:404 stop:964 length:561 start_codon:yes stop_codon:yes gene_type:complete